MPYSDRCQSEAARRSIERRRQSDKREKLIYFGEARRKIKDGHGIAAYALFFQV
jgi:hypothetical protein